MKITVKVKDIKLKIDDNDNKPVIMYESHNNEVQKTIIIMCEQAIKLLEKK